MGFFANKYQTKVDNSASESVYRLKLTRSILFTALVTG